MKKNILFLGAGGIGVSALAIAAKKLGASVCGYDSSPNMLTSKLESIGIPVFSSPSGVDISKFDLVVYSSAILASHPLLCEARTYKVQCLQRAMFLATLMRDFNYSIAVTGTHGKTTTSSILATLMCYLDKTSSFVVGGVVKHTDSNICIQGTNRLVIEADESDASFLNLDPQCIIVTNIDLDHMSTYENNYENLLAKFSDFTLKDSVNNIYMCIDDKGCQDLLEKYPLKSNKNVVLYGFSSQSDAQIINYHISNDGLTNFQICYKDIKYDFAMMLPGKYNVQNATACIINCFDFGFTYADIKEALFRVKGVARRFDVYNKKILGYLITVVDDYGHHPTEVTNCLEAIRERYPDKKIIHVFQPHRYTRNRDLLDDWFHALSISDRLILLPTYSAGESVIKGAESQDIAAGLANCTFADSFDHAIYFIEKYLDKDSIILIQGAGDVTNLVEMVGE